MTDTNQTPEPTPAETPTAALPPTPEAHRVGYADAPAAPGYFTPAPEAAPPAHHKYHATESAVAGMVIGALLFGVLAFGLGWAARGLVARAQLSRAGFMMGQGFGPGGGQFPGGQGQGFGPGGGQFPGGQGQGYGYRRGYGHRGMMGQAPSGGWGNALPSPSAPATPTQ